MRPFKSLAPALLLVAAIALSGCSSMDQTTERTVAGAAIGAGAGAVATVATGGCIACGAAVGGAVGAAGGYVYDQIEKQSGH